MFNIKNIWDYLKQDDRIKLVLAYVVIPFFNVLGCIYLYSPPKGMLIYVILVSLLDIFLIGLLPTIFRFFIKKDGLENSKEIFCYFLLFGAIVSLFYYLVSSSFHFPSIPELFLIYLILSYKCKCGDKELPSLSLVFFMIVGVVFLVSGLQHKSSTVVSALLISLFLTPFRVIKSKKSEKTTESVPDTEEHSLYVHSLNTRDVSLNSQNSPTAKQEKIQSNFLPEDLILKLSFGARIRLSNAITLESVRYKGEVYADIFGCSIVYQGTILTHGGMMVKVSDKAHLLLSIMKVQAMSYILKNARVLNIYNMEIRDLEPVDSSIANRKSENDGEVELNNTKKVSSETPLVKDREPIEPMKLEKPRVVLSKAEQQESSRKLKEYNKWLSEQEDFAEFGKWFMKKLKAKGLTREQVNTALKELVKRRGGNCEEARKLIEKWYQEFQTEQHRR